MNPYPPEGHPDHCSLCKKRDEAKNPHKGSSLTSLFEELGETAEVESLTQKKLQEIENEISHTV